ncbi:MAG: InlB B-repeat-containing protein [Defluviitaleaceae bacterium]|nr:InlB B-repeat-containing protein [Defluviitaleaceae bacterium]
MIITTLFLFLLVGCFNSTPETYAINYKDLGGEVFSGIFIEQQPTTHTIGEETLLVKPQREGHTFLGWFLNIDGSGTSIYRLSPEDEFDADIDLFASWSANSYVVSFNVNGGNELDNNSLTVNFGQEYNLPEPTKTGFTFKGWFNGSALIAQTGIWNIIENVTLIASWSANSYTLTFEVNGGDALQEDTLAVVFGESYHLPEPTRVGHTFVGWFNDSKIFDQEGKWLVPANLVLVANWTANTYQITLDVAGGDLTGNTTISLVFGENYVLPIPFRTGFTFAGWKNGSTPLSLEGNWLLDSDVTLVAVWVSFVSVSVNFGQSVAIDTEGRLWSWGANFGGGTGQGTEIGITTVPTMINTGSTRFKYVTVGMVSTYAIDTEGRIWSWGDNLFASTGLGITEGYTLIPTLVTQGTVRFVQIIAGFANAIAIDTEGRLWSWGQNAGGFTGQGTSEGVTPVPSLINTGNARFEQVFTRWVFQQFVIAIDTEGNLWSWGSNFSGMTGLGLDSGTTLSPTKIDTENVRFQNVSLGVNHTIALDREGNLWGFGSNSHGLTGQGTDLGSTVRPTLILTGTTKFKTIATTRYVNIAIDTEGNLWSWGDNTDGRTGLGIINWTLNRTTMNPTMINTNNVRFTQIVAEEDYAIAIDVEGNLWGWGNNVQNGLGSDRGHTLEPNMIMIADVIFTYLYTSRDFVGAIDSQGFLWIWGFSVFTLGFGEDNFILNPRLMEKIFLFS